MGWEDGEPPCTSALRGRGRPLLVWPFWECPFLLPCHFIPAPKAVWKYGKTLGCVLTHSASVPWDKQAFLINVNLVNERCLATRVVRDAECHVITTEPMVLEEVHFERHALDYKHVSGTNYARKARFYCVSLCT